MQIFHSLSQNDTEQIAQNLAITLPPLCVIALHGDLGAGKTAFVRGLARGLGLDDCVSSPTFTIVNEYGGQPPLYHFDLYRLCSTDELLDIGFEEYISSGICVIEWPNISLSCLTEYINITISKDDKKGDEYRRIEIEHKP